MRKILNLTAAPDSMVGNVHAIAEDGTLVAASATGSQLAPYASKAGKVILVGSQKIDLDIEMAFKHLPEYGLP